MHNHTPDVKRKHKSYHETSKSKKVCVPAAAKGVRTNIYLSKMDSKAPNVTNM